MGFVENVNNAAGNATNINLVAEDIDSVVATGENIDSVVATATDLLGPNNIAVVAADLSGPGNITIAGENIVAINDVAAIDTEVVTVSDNVDDVVITANDIANINIVANAIQEGTAGAGGSGQFLGGSVLGAVMYTGQTTNEDLVLVDGTNGLIVDSIEILDGGSITVQDGAVLKVV